MKDFSEFDTYIKDYMKSQDSQRLAAFKAILYKDICDKFFEIIQDEPELQKLLSEYWKTLDHEYRKFFTHIYPTPNIPCQFVESITKKLPIEEPKPSLFKKLLSMLFRKSCKKEQNG